MNSNINKKVPVLYTDKKDCCGCTACFSICSVHAIKMMSDKKGNYYPVIEPKNCRCCYLCLQVCPIKNS